MRITTVAAALFTAHALAAPTRYSPHTTQYEPPTLPNNGTDAAPYAVRGFPPPSPSMSKLEGLLTSLTSSTLSILVGSTTTMVGYAICGLTMPAESWETCTDYAVVAGSCVGISHLVIWKFPEIMNDLHVYESTAASWEALSAWSLDDAPDAMIEIKRREGIE